VHRIECEIDSVLRHVQFEDLNETGFVFDWESNISFSIMSRYVC
jgi:hypothetical protein